MRLANTIRVHRDLGVYCVLLLLCFWLQVSGGALIAKIGFTSLVIARNMVAVRK